jgi:ABC-type Fe3+-hydroxamate transport system substrate-binding protein
MRNIKSFFIILASISLLLFTACNSKNSENSSVTKTEETTKKIDASSQEKDQKKDDVKHKESKNNSHGGQVVEVGKYHLELVANKEENKTHIDLFLEDREKHQVIPNAKVTGEIQLPDGTQKTLDFKYEVEGEHYVAILASNAAGQYQVKITADVASDKVNGRFSINL